MMNSYDVATVAPVLTPRQDRWERAITEALRRGSPRSELRAAVHELVDLFRLQRVPVEQGVARIRRIVVQTIGAVAVTDRESAWAGDGTADRLSLVMQWAVQRYRRDD